jgi:DNA mismatch repair protein MutS2
MDAVCTSKTLADLGFDRIQQALAGLCHSEPGRVRAAAVLPTSDAAELQARRTLFEQGHRLIEQAGRPDLQFPDPRPALERLMRGEPILEPLALLELAQAEQTARSIAALRTQCQPQRDLELLDRLEAITDHSALIGRIHRAVAPDGSVKDEASPLLGRLRSELLGARQRIQADLLQFLRQHPDAGQEPVVTERAGRFVVPIKADFRGRIEGLVHDYSSSRRTAFMEPSGYVRQNNRIQELLGDEREEVARILRELTDEVRHAAPSIQRNLEVLAGLDVLFASAALAIRHQARLCPLQPDDIRLLAARHPLLAKELCVPVDLRLEGPTRLLLVSGPNGGGKTVALKTLGLLVLMHQAGLAIPADPQGSGLCVFERVAVDIGDPQQLGSDSTFTGHVRALRALLAEAGPGWLVLLDEIGAGTDPEEGGALGTAVLEALVQAGARIAATTHLLRVKAFAHTQSWAQLAATELDPQTHEPTFRLLYGVPGRSNALQIAENLGFPLDVLRRARERLQAGQLEFEDLIRRLEASRKELGEAIERAEREKDQAGLARRQYELKRSQGFAEGLEQVRADSAELLIRLRELAQRRPGEVAKGEIRRVERQLASLEARARPTRARALGPAQAREGRRPISVGDQVLVVPLGVRGEVLEIDPKRNSATVQGPKFSVTTALADLEWTSPSAARAEAALEPGSPERPEKTAAMEIDLRGNRVEDGLELTQRCLSDAALSGLPSVRIIHGMGTGRLRSAIQQMLQKHPLVLSFRDGGEGEGGLGVTIAKLSD